MNSNIPLIAFAVGCVIGCFVGGAFVQKIYKEDAINSGAAIWTINPHTGDSKFEWRGSLPPKQPTER